MGFGVLNKGPNKVWTANKIWSWLTGKEGEVDFLEQTVPLPRSPLHRGDDRGYMSWLCTMAGLLRAKPQIALDGNKSEVEKLHGYSSEDWHRAYMALRCAWTWMRRTVESTPKAHGCLTRRSWLNSPLNLLCCFFGSMTPSTTSFASRIQEFGDLEPSGETVRPT